MLEKEVKFAEIKKRTEIRDRSEAYYLLSELSSHDLRNNAIFQDAEISRRRNEIKAIDERLDALEERIFAKRN